MTTTMQRYRLAPGSKIAALYAALPMGEWITAKDAYACGKALVNPQNQLSALVARGLVERRERTPGTRSGEYRKLPEVAAIEQPTRAWTPPPPAETTDPVERVREQMREDAREKRVTTTPILHGTARCYLVNGCRWIECERAYHETQKALGLA